MKSNAAERMRQSRERRKEGRRILRVPVHIDTVEALVELDYLRVEELHDLNAVARAVSRFIDASTESVACNGITILDW